MKRSAIATGRRAEELLTRKIVIDFDGDDSIEVEVRTTAFQAASKSLENIADFDDEDEAKPVIAKFLAAVIKSWDEVLDEDDSPLEPTQEVLETFELLQLLVLVAAITEALTPDPKGPERLTPQDRKPSSKSSRPSTKSATKPRKS
ncbi:hypothetical protein [uncultured Friedmanniella sp.]|uniref:hypothetical protein n=1 Tax=uncultured Friedmanniella sp. TaxID=335381 RepID=UPI0035CB0086